MKIPFARKDQNPNLSTTQSTTADDKTSFAWRTRKPLALSAALVAGATLIAFWGKQVALFGVVTVVAWQLALILAFAAVVLVAGFIAYRDMRVRREERKALAEEAQLKSEPRAPAPAADNLSTPAPGQQTINLPPLQPTTASVLG